MTISMMSSIYFILLSFRLTSIRSLKVLVISWLSSISMLPGVGLAKWLLLDLRSFQQNTVRKFLLWRYDLIIIYHMYMSKTTNKNDFRLMLTNAKSWLFVMASHLCLHLFSSRRVNRSIAFQALMQINLRNSSSSTAHKLELQHLHVCEWWWWSAFSIINLITFECFWKFHINTLQTFSEVL